MNKKALLNEIVQCCETRFDRGSAQYWRQSDFNELSKEIQRETKVSISLSTLKRIFGKTAMDDDYVPQQATIEALKSYGKYVAAVKQPPIISGNKITQSRYSRGLLVIGLCIFVLIIGLLIWQVFKPANNKMASIKLERMEGILPATAFFDIRSSDTSDSLFVDFGDRSPIIYIKPGQKRCTHIYLFPGIFDVVLQTRKEMLNTVKTYVHSDRWIGMGFHRQRDLQNHYYEFPAVKVGKDSLFHISNVQLQKVGLDTTTSNFTRLCNFTSVGAGADDFIFETSVKNNLLEKGIYCHSVQFNIHGQNGSIRFQLVNPGCSSHVWNIISEQTYQGAENNLSQFVIDLERWNTLRLVNRKKHVVLSVNGKQIYAGSYQKSLGELKGLSVEFEGTGFVKSCTLTTIDGKPLYRF
ncbi:hypothetical protein C8P68_101409 [Mucilaginibacter yixingensis]|uniref:Uncharacterized protein n=1 Tax=Mucilaginibacter yixingensis TaxID=1295612 RepID=A0A2T5JFN8_9SPHI|nr:hypothetical protein [Mucilaginibacter yixingensis]PTR01176.1 hypothetical protein C8P68_101409 [Mucilaginibacter yixingensis]